MDKYNEETLSSDKMKQEYTDMAESLSMEFKKNRDTIKTMMTTFQENVSGVLQIGNAEYRIGPFEDITGRIVNPRGGGYYNEIVISKSLISEEDDLHFRVEFGFSDFDISSGEPIEETYGSICFDYINGQLTDFKCTTQEDKALKKVK